MQNFGCCNSGVLAALHPRPHYYNLSIVLFVYVVCVSMAGRAGGYYLEVIVIEIESEGKGLAIFLGVRFG